MYTHWRNTTGPLLISISAMVFVISFYKTRFWSTERTSHRGNGNGNSVGIFVCLRAPRSLCLSRSRMCPKLHLCIRLRCSEKIPRLFRLSQPHTNSSHNFHFDLISAPSDRNRIATYLYRRMKMIAMQRCNYFYFALPVWRLCLYVFGRMSKVETCNREIFPEKSRFLLLLFSFSFHRLFDENEYFS